MPTEAGEFIVGAYLQHFCNCTFVLYNVRLPGGGLEGLPELDVVGLNLPDHAAYLCEVTTHLHGMRPTVPDRIVAKHEQQKRHAARMLAGYTVHYQLWSPVVQRAQLAKLRALTTMELVVNSAFTQAVEQLRQVAKSTEAELGNLFMRTLRILAHLKASEPPPSPPR